MKYLIFYTKILFIIICIYKSQNTAGTDQDVKNRLVEIDILKQMNDVRTDPQTYLKNVVDPAKSRYTTGDGLVGYNELVEILKVQKSLSAIKMDLGMRIAAYEHSSWMDRTKYFSHTGENDSTFGERMAKYGKSSGGSGEIIFAGSTNGTIIILDYLVDGGIPSRGHRKIILNENFKQAGIGAAKIFSTMNFASNFTDIPGLKPLPGTPENEITSSPSIIIQVIK